LPARASAAPFVTWGSIQAEDFQAMNGELKRLNFANRVRSFAALSHADLVSRQAKVPNG
jgi:hypothetical protein